MPDSYDYIVVGGGASGSIVASRLAQAGGRILLLEAGGTDKRFNIRVPGAVASAYKTANWKYPVTPDPTRTGSPEAWKAGKILGGGGSINSCVYVRGNRADYDGWAAMGCDGWDYKSVLPSFKRMETWESGASEYRGGDGPISVVTQTDRGTANSGYYEAAQQAGFAANPDYNGATQDGVSFVQVNHRRGLRSQASHEYLKRVAPRNSVTVMTDTLVTRLLFEGNRVIGVEYVREGKTERSLAKQEVILSAGSLSTPKLLKLSGIGPREELEALGIDVLKHIPGVGANLQDHAMLMQCWHANGVQTLNRLTLAHKIKGLYQYLLRGTGFLAMTVVPVQVMAKSDTSLSSPDLQFCFAPFSLSAHRDENGMFDVSLTKEEGFFSSSIFLHPRARGSVSLRSASPLDMPVIKYQVFEDLGDLRDTLTGLREVQRVMAQPAMAAITKGRMDMDAPCKTDEDWKRYARNMTSSASHAAGSCRMGNDDMAVVDNKLRVNGIKGLRIADASIMPTITTGNTNAPAMMIGEHASALILMG